jgi:hypothetical protein
MRRMLTCVVIAVSMVGCIRPSTSDSVALLRSTADNMVKIDSGELQMRFAVETSDDDASGFELNGPFSLVSDGRYPVAELEHTRFDGDEEQQGTFVSDGQRVSVEGDGRRTAVSEAVLSASGLAQLTRDRDDQEGESALAEVDVSSWVDGEPEVAGGGLVEGVDTDKVRADLDVAEVINGFIELGRTLGSGAAARLEPIAGDDISRVKRATDEATLEIWSGKNDRILRKVVANIVFAVPNKDVAERLGELSGATVTLEATLGAVNEPAG